MVLLIQVSKGERNELDIENNDTIKNQLMTYSLEITLMFKNEDERFSELNYYLSQMIEKVENNNKIEFNVLRDGALEALHEIIDKQHKKIVDLDTSYPLI